MLWGGSGVDRHSKSVDVVCGGAPLDLTGLLPGPSLTMPFGPCAHGASMSLHCGEKSGRAQGGPVTGAGGWKPAHLSLEHTTRTSSFPLGPRGFLVQLWRVAAVSGHGSRPRLREAATCLDATRERWESWDARALKTAAQWPRLAPDQGACLSTRGSALTATLPVLRRLDSSISLALERYALGSSALSA